VIRDTEGYDVNSHLYPWFTTKGSGTSRRDVLAQKDAVRVKSCWSGMAAYEATPFLRNEVLEYKPLVQQYPTSEVSASDGKPQRYTPTANLLEHHTPLRFRSQPDLLEESSECCLFNADLLARHPDREPQVYVNPYVRVAYDYKTWHLQPWFQRIERISIPVQWIISKAGFKFPINPRRAETPGMKSTQRRRVYDKAVLNGEVLDRQLNITSADFDGSMLAGRWTETTEIALPGGYCAIRSLFFMVRDLKSAYAEREGKNWANLSINERWPVIQHAWNSAFPSFAVQVP
jgi:hypothetical protein